MNKHTIHEDDIETKELPGRRHKMAVRPDNMGAEKMCAGTAVFPANKHAPSHVHEKEEEILYVLEGEGNMYFDGKAEPIRKGTFMLVPPGVEHSLESVTSTELKVFYVFSPSVKQGSYDRQ